MRLLPRRFNSQIHCSMAPLCSSAPPHYCFWHEKTGVVNEFLFAAAAVAIATKTFRGLSRFCRRGKRPVLELEITHHVATALRGIMTCGGADANTAVFDARCLATTCLLASFSVAHPAVFI